MSVLHNLSYNYLYIAAGSLSPKHVFKKLSIFSKKIDGGKGAANYRKEKYNN